MLIPIYQEQISGVRAHPHTRLASHGDRPHRATLYLKQRRSQIKVSRIIEGLCPQDDLAN